MPRAKEDPKKVSDTSLLTPGPGEVLDLETISKCFGPEVVRGMLGGATLLSLELTQVAARGTIADDI